jgi:ribose transport system substrate-binding protein
VFAGCGEDESAGSGATATTGGDEPVRIAYLAPKANTYADATFKGVEEAAKEAGATATYVDSTFEPAKEFAALQDIATSGKYDAAIVIALDSAGLVPAAEQAIEAGVKVVSTNFVLGTDLQTREVQVDGQAGAVFTPSYIRGQLFGEAIVDACEDADPCNVGWIQSIAGLPWDTALLDGAKDYLKDHPSVKLASVQGNGNYLAADGLKVAQNMLQANSDLDVLLTTSDQSTAGAQQAVEKAGLSGKVKLMGYGGSCIATEAIEAGDWAASVTATPFSEGRLSAELAIEAVRTDTAGTVIDAVEEIGAPKILTQETVGDFECEWDG